MISYQSFLWNFFFSDRFCNKFYQRMFDLISLIPIDMIINRRWPSLMSRLIRAQYSGHMTSIDQSQASIRVTWPYLMTDLGRWSRSSRRGLEGQGEADTPCSSSSSSWHTPCILPSSGNIDQVEWLSKLTCSQGWKDESLMDTVPVIPVWYWDTSEEKWQGYCQAQVWS